MGRVVSAQLHHGNLEGDLVATLPGAVEDQQRRSKYCVLQRCGAFETVREVSLFQQNLEQDP